LAKLLAVLLGVLFWLPGLQVRGPKLAQPSESAVCRAGVGGGPVGESESDEAPSEAREAEDGEDLESSLVGPQLFGPRTRLTAAGSIRVGVSEYERERLAATHSVLARDRGPPVG
jgi:hypothetical protein